MTQLSGSPATWIQEDTSLTEYRIAKHGTDAREVVAATDASAQLVGITREDATGVAAEPVSLVMLGVAKLTVLAASTKGDAMTATTGGKGATTTTGGDFCIGWLLETTTVANQVAEVLVNPFIYDTT